MGKLTLKSPIQAFHRHHRMLLVTSLVVLIVMVTSLGVIAAVGVTEFKASPESDGSIRVYWHTETEVDITSFRLYRAQSQDEIGELLQDSLIDATGDLAGNDYHYIDSHVTPGITYYYTLENLPSLDRFANKAVATASVPATPTSTATPRATPSPTNTPTRTPTRRITPYILTPVPTDRPTATRLYTITPPPAPTALSTATRPPVQFQPAQPATVTPAPGRVTTPTGQAIILAPTPMPTIALPMASSPTTEQASSGNLIEMTETPTAELTSSASPSPTLSPVVTSTPQKAARFLLATPGALPTPRPTPTPAEDSDRNTRWMMVTGGGILGLTLLAGIIAALIWYARGRQ
jgi:hypothetical protein